MFHVHLMKLVNDLNKFEKNAIKISQIHFENDRLIWFDLSSADCWRDNEIISEWTQMEIQ
jgi:hypothetical protein